MIDGCYLSLENGWYEMFFFKWLMQKVVMYYIRYAKLIKKTEKERKSMIIF